MAKQFFVLGIGGTGMRCIESLIHLCAMGMFDDTVIHLLALDTDKNNGNFARLKEVKEAYLNAKGLNGQQRTTHKDTFFSANIKYYEFSPNYEQKSSFSAVFNYGDTQYNNRQETDLADLVLDSNVENFNLLHGYRAQTHLGSMMMYQSLIEAAQSTMNNDLKNFVSALIAATAAGTAKVFILGSVFGGTGASSIPVIPRALTRAAAIMSGGSSDVLKNVYFGATLLTAYFNFKIPDAGEVSREKVIATSDKFALNSQAAMMFYADDTSVKQTYQRFYMLGTNGLNWDPQGEKKTDKTITGGAAQKNDSHYIELMAACAARDFFNTPDEKLAAIKGNPQAEAEYLYRSVNDSGKLEYQDFVGQNYQTEFARRLGCLVAFAILNNGEDDLVESARSGKDQEMPGFENIDPNQVRYLKDYFRLFFTRSEAGNLQEGWLQQLHRSAGGGSNLMLNAKLFEPRTLKALNRLAWNKEIYGDDPVGKSHKFSTGLFSSPFDKFKKQFLQILNSDKSTGITNPGERFYKITYDTLGCIFQFIQFN